MSHAKIVAMENSSPSKSSLVQFLKLLSKEEMKEFEKFVVSPFHNNRSDVTRLFFEIKKYYPDFNIENLTKEGIYSAAYPGESFKDDKLRRVMSNLFKLGEKYLSYLKFRDDRFTFGKSLLDQYIKKDSDKFIRKQVVELKDHLDKRKSRGADYYYKRGLIEEIERTCIIKDDPTLKNFTYEEEINTQWAYIFTSLLRLYGFTKHQMFLSKKKYETELLNPLLKIAAESDFMGSKAAEIHYNLILLYTEEEADEIFIKVKARMEKNIDIFEKEEAFTIYAMLLGYCSIQKVKPGKDYTRHEFELAKAIVENSLHLANGSLDTGWFLGIFFRAFNAGEIEYAEKFIERNKKFVYGSEKDSVISHAYAHLALHKNDFENAMKHLLNASYKNPNDKITVNYMYLRIYFETNNHEQFFYCTDSFRHLLKNEKSLSKELINVCNNFIKFTEKLFKLKLNEIKLEPAEIKNEILKSEVIGRKWLLEKAVELETR